MKKNPKIDLIKSLFKEIEINIILMLFLEDNCMKKKPKIDIEKQTEKVADLIKSLFKEIENIAHIKINSIADKEEIKNLYIKIEIKKDMYFELSLFNLSTNSLVVKPYEIISFMTLCKLNMLNPTITMDVEKLYKTSLLKAYDEITKIFLD